MNGTISKQEAKVLYEENITYIYRAALFLTKSKELAEDISQEVFMRAFDKYHTFDMTKPVRPWLYQIMLNMIRSYYRKNIFHIQLEALTKLPQDETTFVEQNFFKKEEDRYLWHKISSLSLKLREVLVLHFYMDMTLEEVAQILKIPLGTCKSRLNAALTKLRQDEYIQNITYLLGGHEL